MSLIYRHLLRPLLFTQDSERVHRFVLRCLQHAGRSRWMAEGLGSWYRAPELPVPLFGCRFPNPVGLAAGMDKEAMALPIWQALGFGFVELGGVTRYAQPGNPPPRIFRIPDEQALLNRMGLNNPGAETFAATLAAWKDRGRWPSHPVGINLGKSKEVPNEEAVEDYTESFRILWPHADFFVVNVSSPNTPGLRELQDKHALEGILESLQAVNRQQAQSGYGSRNAGFPSETAASPQGFPNDRHPHTPAGSPRPILIKIAPDLEWEALDELLELAERHHIAGLVATNTTTSRPEASSRRARRLYKEAGGLSGQPLRARSTEIIRHLYRQSRGRLPIIGVGGIFHADHAWEKIIAGASLVQIYTGLIFEGPSLTQSIVRGLRLRLHREGLTDLQEAVGIASETKPSAQHP